MLGRIPDIERPQIRHLEFFAERAALFVPLHRGEHHPVHVLIERHGPRGNTGVFVVTIQKFRFQREERLAVGVDLQYIRWKRICMVVLQKGESKRCCRCFAQGV